ncbi:MAG: GDP-mannose 4,6-dehydratase [Candidatus Saccharicenans sp.]|uniref:GDP-mannose 4,6-dehydratase n=1 Tax=Candidatus Saccharicenans sp. TaxID=2819258 RepID=UPI00404A48C3
MIRVLITGATGFAGSHLIKALNEEGTESYDIYGTSFPDKPEPGGKIVFLDIRSRKDVMDLVSDVRPEWIFHLAAVSSVRRSWEDTQGTIEINLLGTHNLLEAAKLFAPEARILFVSSSEIYKFDKKRKKPVNERSPLKILSPYAYSKFAGEKLCEFYVRAENLDIIIVRPFPHTGPGQSEQFVCSDWAKQIVEIENGKRPPVIQVGNLNIIRDFSDVRDVVKAYIMLVKKGRKGQSYNVCRGRTISLRKILSLLLKEVRVAGRISVEADSNRLRRIDSAFQAGERKKITRETGWKPEIAIEQSLKDLLEYWRAKKKEIVGTFG